ncbi:hypothetical protein HYW75_03435 [Candidatus Pacearchaeota archaeon]|nr:hypothetical protein [Candidatus Pacearchaeota archaeon]
MRQEITTIKLSKKTKDRIEHLRSYKRESYEDILEKMLDVLNICRFEPGKAQGRLEQIERERKNNIKSFNERNTKNISERPREKSYVNNGKFTSKFTEKLRAFKGTKLNI